ncbi:DNA-binding transcriptional LysR family regulator [Frondihabitans sp. PhB188]|uniref:LysR family transcriptional regulator n=1 Tax=Frondihabitans sp. PhB188 TaxID=2485200 RepID=UPI000F47ABE2|nr:LysR family transcriptional regulator [Frondihabitans sp. PhB188]ROQ41187.1 DNA-binding transcriptional LysR family regulator [Frondihabitans sp. PhB188]
MDVHDLRALRALAETGSITAAAARLGYSQPAITQRLRRAEAEAGQPLLLRTGRTATLTEAGRRLARHAVHVEAALAAAHDELDALAGTESGALRLAGFPSASPTLVPALLADLAARHPGLTTSYLEAEPPEAVELLRRGEIDLALTFTYPGDGGLPDADVVEVPLFRDTMLAVAPAGTFPAQDAGHLEFLREMPFIAGCPRCRGHLLAVCRLAGFEPRIVLETDNALAVTGLVAAGLGVALLPSLSLVPAALPDGVEVRALGDDSDRIVAVAHARGAEGIPAVGAGLRAARRIAPASFGLRAAERRRAEQPAAAG